MNFQQPASTVIKKTHTRIYITSQVTSGDMPDFIKTYCSCIQATFQQDRGEYSFGSSRNFFFLNFRCPRLNCSRLMTPFHHIRALLIICNLTNICELPGQPNNQNATNNFALFAPFQSNLASSNTSNLVSFVNTLQECLLLSYLCVRIENWVKELQAIFLIQEPVI